MKITTSRMQKLPKQESIPHSDRILNVLRSSGAGDITIQEIAVQSNLNRITAAKYLAVLEAQNAVQFRRVGKAKLYSVKGGFGG